MVLIDGDHSYEGCLKDYHLELEMPHRFIAFHDVANKKYTGVAEVWKNDVSGLKIEFTNTHQSTSTRFADKYITECGIGIVVQ